MTLNYKIQFLDYWHIGSGLSAGAKLDSMVLKDSDNLPFIGGKTIKGLVREMAELLESEAFVNRCFGDEGIDMGICYFSNVTIDELSAKEIVSNDLQENLYVEIASTKIEDGMAVDGSLREIEAVIPITLVGCIENIDSTDMEKMRQALKMIKRMGLNRNRGLGRCQISVEVE